MKKKNKYWVQTMHVIICPDGSAFDYYSSKKKANKDAKKLNTDRSER